MTTSPPQAEQPDTDPRSTFERVHDIIVSHLGVESRQVTPTASLQDDLGADSLDAVELIMEAEDVFRVELPEELIENVVTVADLVALVDRVRAEQR